MVQPTPSYVSYEDFLEAELRSPTKHEWLDGVVYAMAGGTLEHSRLAVNVTAALKIAFPTCTVFQSDAMILVRATGLSTYADGVIVCGAIDTQKVERSRRVIGEALINPTVIVEVLSNSTETYDRSEKFAHYMRIPSLREYILVSQDARRIEVFRRPKHGRWDVDEVTAGDIRVLDARIRVEDVY